MEDFKVGDQVVFISEIPHNPLLIGTKGEVLYVKECLQRVVVMWDTHTGEQIKQTLPMQNIAKVKEKSTMEKGKDSMVEAVVSLMECAERVGGGVPNMDMSLREFITCYGWNGVSFALTESKKRALTKSSPKWNTREEAYDVINSIDNDRLTIKLTPSGWSVERENV